MILYDISSIRIKIKIKGAGDCIVDGKNLQDSFPFLSIIHDTRRQSIANNEIE